MTNEELNTALYEKMFAGQETYRAWLLSQPLADVFTDWENKKRTHPRCCFFPPASRCAIHAVRHLSGRGIDSEVIDFKRFSFNIPAENSGILHLFESAIDLLSFATIRKLNGMDWRKDHLLLLAGVYPLSGLRRLYGRQ